MIKSIEDIAFLAERRVAAGQPPVNSLLELYRGTDIVNWWGGIQRAIIDKIKKYKADDGHKEEIHQLETFLEVWTKNQLTGSISRGTLTILHSAASMAAANTDLDTYSFFSYLRDSLGSLLASVDELPPIPSSTGRRTTKENPPSTYGSPIKTPPPTAGSTPVAPTGGNAPTTATPVAV